MKSRNGQGTGRVISLEFNLSVPVEQKAWRMSQRLASIGHGQRKSVLIAALAALADYSELTRKDVTTEELAATFLQALLSGGMPTAAPISLASHEDVEIEVTPAGISPEDIAATFLRSTMQTRDEDEDLWDE